MEGTRHILPWRWKASAAPTSLPERPFATEVLGVERAIPARTDSYKPISLAECFRRHTVLDATSRWEGACRSRSGFALRPMLGGSLQRLLLLFQASLLHLQYLLQSLQLVDLAL